MTFKHQYKVMIGVMVLLAHAFIANAQEEEKRNTSESLGKQFLNNRVPGLQYAPEKPKAQRRATVAEQEENHSESSGMQLKKGTIRGMRFAPGSGTANTSPNTSRSAARAQAARVALPSEQKAGEQKITPAANTHTVPTQDGVTEPKEKELKQAPATKAIKKEAAKKNNNQ